MREVIVNAFSTPSPNLLFTKSSCCLKAASVSFLLPPFRSLITAFSLPPIPIPTLPPIHSYSFFLFFQARIHFRKAQETPPNKAQTLTGDSSLRRRPWLRPSLFPSTVQIPWSRPRGEFLFQFKSITFFFLLIQHVPCAI